MVEVATTTADGLMKTPKVAPRVQQACSKSNVEIREIVRDGSVVNKKENVRDRPIVNKKDSEKTEQPQNHQTMPATAMRNSVSASTGTSKPPSGITIEALKARKGPTERELAGLKTGKRVNVFRRLPYIELLFSVPVNLVKYFSAEWKRQLDEQNAKALYLNANKNTIRFIIEWMAAGGRDSTADGAIRYPQDCALNILALNKLAYCLRVISLYERTLSDFDHLTRRPLNKIMDVAVILTSDNVPPETSAVFQHNVKSWILAVDDTAWQAIFQKANSQGRQRNALIAVAQLRADSKKSQAVKPRKLHRKNYKGRHATEAKEVKHTEQASSDLIITSAGDNVKKPSALYTRSKVVGHNTRIRARRSTVPTVSVTKPAPDAFKIRPPMSKNGTG